MRLLIFFLSVLSAQSATIRFAITNSDLTPCTNTLRIFPVTTPIRVDGSWDIRGISSRLPLTNGVAAIRLSQGNYYATNTGYYKLFAVPTGTGVYDATSLEISGGNVYNYTPANISVAPGTNVMVETNGNTFTISATGGSVPEGVVTNGTTNASISITGNAATAVSATTATAALGLKTATGTNVLTITSDSPPLLESDFPGQSIVSASNVVAQLFTGNGSGLTNLNGAGIQAASIPTAALNTNAQELLSAAASTNLVEQATNNLAGVLMAYANTGSNAVQTYAIGVSNRVGNAVSNGQAVVEFGSGTFSNITVNSTQTTFSVAQDAYVPGWLHVSGNVTGAVFYGSAAGLTSLPATGIAFTNDVDAQGHGLTNLSKLQVGASTAGGYTNRLGGTTLITNLTLGDGYGASIATVDDSFLDLNTNGTTYVKFLQAYDGITGTLTGTADNATTWNGLPTNILSSIGGGGITFSNDVDGNQRGLTNLARLQVGSGAAVAGYSNVLGGKTLSTNLTATGSFTGPLTGTATNASSMVNADEGTRVYTDTANLHIAADSGEIYLDTNVHLPARDIHIGGTAYGNASGLTNLSASALVGTLDDKRLSTNVVTKTGTNVFGGTNTFNGVTVMNGNVGIGTTNPQDALHVAKDSYGVIDISPATDVTYPLAKTMGQLRFLGAPAGNTYWSGVVGTRQETGYANQMGLAFYVTSSGVPAAAWSILDTGQLQSTGAQAIQTTGTGALTLVANSTTVSVGGAAGNVGVGTTTPTNKLEVIGNAHIVGDLSCSNVVDLSSSPASLEDALAIVSSIETKNGKVDHAKLSPLAWGTKEIGNGTFTTNKTEMVVPAVTNMVDKIVGSITNKVPQIVGSKTNITTTVTEGKVAVPDQSKRSLSMVVSAQALVIKDLLRRIETLETRVNKLEGK